jgi:hypothetical protein
LTLSDQDIELLLSSMETESRAIREESIRITWWMRGGINYEQAMQLSVEERDIISNLIKENIEATKKSGMPFF